MPLTYDATNAASNGATVYRTITTTTSVSVSEGSPSFLSLFIHLSCVSYINAPEGCRHGTHTNGTAYIRGTYSRVHTQDKRSVLSYLTHTNTHKHKQTHKLVCIYLSPQPRATRIPELPAWHRAPTPRPCEDDARLATNVVHRAWRHRDCSDRASAASPHAVVIALRARAGRGGCAHHEKPTKRALHRERCSSRRWRPATRGAAAATSVGS